MGDSSAAPSPIDTTFLIVGAGPAGSALASFLASYKLTGIVVASAAGTAREPRAHITNPAALECLRDIGLEEEVQNNATHGHNMIHTLWAHSMTGAEYGRLYAWGHKPDRKGDYDAASPCRHVDLPQTLLEPILVKNAMHKGWKLRFDSQFVEFHRDTPEGPITSTIKDLVTGTTYSIRSKYLFGCDGGRSQVMRQLNLPLIKAPGQGLAINILVKVDLSDHVRYRTGNLHWLCQPDIEHPAWGWTCIARMVKPWHEWMFIILAEPGFQDTAIDIWSQDYTSRIRQFIGRDDIPFQVLDISKWFINEIVAETYHSGNIFCLGDAVHRHPPINGLGSNTCIQDAYNLAWKIAHVEKGLASPSHLLPTYSTERQPIGAGIVQRANQGLRDHVPIWTALGAMAPTLPERQSLFQELSSPTPQGRARRRQLRAGIDYCEHEYGGIGIEMNQGYESTAIIPDDEDGPRPALPPDPVLHYRVSTYPGSKLPHAWLNRRVPDRPAVSTQDLAGKGAFCVFTGIGGDSVWKEAGRRVEGAVMGLKVNVYSIGWMQDYEDIYGEWEKRRGVEEDGCVVVRPDRTVCWRSQRLREDAGEKLVSVIKRVLGVS